MKPSIYAMTKALVEQHGFTMTMPTLYNGQLV